MEDKKTLLMTKLSGIIAVLLITVFIFTAMKQGNDSGAKIMNDFKSAFNSKEKKVIYYASSKCHYCELQTPILETIAEDYDMNYFKIDVTKLSNKQKNELDKTLKIEGATPTTLVVKNGEIIDTKVGYVEGKEYVKFLVDAGILPEDAVYSKEQYITSIDFDEYKELISDGLHAIVIGQTGCSHCTAIKPALNTVGREYKIKINYLNLADLTEDENNEFFDSLRKIEYNDPDFVEEGSFGTPLTLFIKNYDSINCIRGYKNYNETKSIVEYVYN